MRRATLGALVVLVACEPAVVSVPPPGQIVLYVDTDAPLPTGRLPTTLEPAPLFDRLRVEVLAPGETTPCDACANEFSVDEALLERRAASVGIAPPPGVAGYRARMRLFYRELRGADGLPDADATIEHVVALPVVSELGKIEITVVLRTEEVGAAVGTLDEPEPAVLGAPGASLVGTWPPAQRVDCASSPPPGMVCVPGGAYWMGDRSKLFAVLPESDVNAPRLVALSPFFLDEHEVTVAEFRADGKGTADAARAGGDGSESSDFCTFTEAAEGREARALNCITWVEARAYCKRRGADLPTEAQYEYVASGLQGHDFVWGDDLPSCEDAVYSRLGWGAFRDSLATCRPKRPPGGVEAPGRGARDRLELATGTIVDLIGNVNEWQRDVWNRADEPCWARPGVYFDPLCTKAGAKGPNARVLRGGAWTLLAGQLERTSRTSATRLTTILDTGFRCAAAPE